MQQAPEKPAATEVVQKTFASPDDAGKALTEAAKAGNHDALIAIFGPGSQDVIFSGDTAQDKTSFDNFTAAYGTMNRWRKQTDGSEVLYLGADNNPFPIPLKKNSAGGWYFDTAAGKDEILSRRIGDNDLAAIDVVAAMADAQNQYFSQRHDGVKQYAQKFVSDDGKQNGLYWKSPEGQPKSPLGTAFREHTPLLPKGSAQWQTSSSHSTGTSIAFSPSRARTPKAAPETTSQTER